MRQSSRVEPLNPSSPAIGLHPVLSLALANLDIQLEDELVRYRRQRLDIGRAVPQSGRKQSPSQIDLIAVSAMGGRTSATTQPAPALEERLSSITDPTIAPDTYKPIPAFSATPQPPDAAIALRPPDPLNHNGASDKAASSEGDDAHALAQANSPNLDDYLESSEELLRSLADEQAEVQAERSFMQSLLTPLGLGSMLLLLLSSAMFGYVIMNPSSLGWLTAQRNASTGLLPRQNPGTVAPAPPQPDLAKRELPELNLNNLGTVNVSPGSSSPVPTQTATAPTRKPTIATTTPAPNASSARQSSSEAPSTLLAPMPAVTSGSSRPSPVVRTATPPQPAPRHSVPVAPVATVRPAPATTSAPPVSTDGAGASSYQYKVGIPFENDQTLESARKVVPDAFVRTLPDGRTIVQVGAARSESEVKTSMQGLRDRGLPAAEVYKR